MTIRLEPALRLRLGQAAARRQLTPSAAARVALATWVDSEERSAAERPFEQLQELLGCLHGGEASRSLSRRAGRRRRRSGRVGR